MNTSNASIAVDVEHGGRLSSLVVHGHELLVGRSYDDNPLAWGSYPMVPFAGRIGGGVVHFDGSTHQLPPTMGDHAIHGYGYVDEWTQIGDDEIEWEFREPWPWAGRARQRFELADERLTLHMTLLTEDRQPVSFGWHPWFVKRLDSGEIIELDFHADLMYELGPDEIPTGRLVTPPPGPWDNCFTHIVGAPTVRWGELALELSANADHWVVYDKPEHATCVEPQTGPPNDINFAPFVLDAEQSATLDFSMTWRTDK